MNKMSCPDKKNFAYRSIEDFGYNIIYDIYHVSCVISSGEADPHKDHHNHVLFMPMGEADQATILFPMFSPSVFLLILQYPACICPLTITIPVSPLMSILSTSLLILYNTSEKALSPHRKISYSFVICGRVNMKRLTPR